jgi:hypothetical protein
MNTTNKTEIILGPDSKIIRRKVTEEEIILQPDVLTSISGNIVRTVYHAFELDSLPVRICAGKDSSQFMVPVKELRLKAPFAAESGGILQATFSGKEPIFDLGWVVPDDMKLWFIATIVTMKYPQLVECHLLAFDTGARCYRLPLGNLFEGQANICMGEFDATGKTCQEILQKCWVQFNSSQWNGDLDTKPAWAAGLFRYYAKNDGFIQLAPEVAWTELATKIAPPILNFITI